MKLATQFFLFLTIILWANIIEAITYSHIAFLPSYLSHLPESSILVTGNYPIEEGKFWTMIHPLTVLSLIITILLNWKNNSRRKYLLISLGIYALALIATFTYFLPELGAFRESNSATTISAEEWLARGQRWQSLSLIRGFGMLIGFLMLLVALTKKSTTPSVARL